MPKSNALPVEVEDVIDKYGQTDELNWLAITLV